mgnify:CR=1 FL=1
MGQMILDYLMVIIAIAVSWSYGDEGGVRSYCGSAASWQGRP